MKALALLQEPLTGCSLPRAFTRGGKPPRPQKNTNVWSLFFVAILCALDINRSDLSIQYP